MFGFADALALEELQSVESDLRVDEFLVAETLEVIGAFTRRSQKVVIVPTAVNRPVLRLSSRELVQAGEDVVWIQR